jgi:hypothetical protein
MMQLGGVFRGRDLYHVAPGMGPIPCIDAKGTSGWCTDASEISSPYFEFRYCQRERAGKFYTPGNIVSR